MEWNQQKGSSSLTMEAPTGNVKDVLIKRHVMIGLGGKKMTKEMIQTAQDYLTVATKENGKKEDIGY